jgi:hypothetical protein
MRWGRAPAWRARACVEVRNAKPRLSVTAALSGAGATRTGSSAAIQLLLDRLQCRGASVLVPASPPGSSRDASALPPPFSPPRPDPCSQAGVSVTATESIFPSFAALAADPLVEGGLSEDSIATLLLHPHQVGPRGAPGAPQPRRPPALALGGGGGGGGAARRGAARRVRAEAEPSRRGGPSWPPLLARRALVCPPPGPCWASPVYPSAGTSPTALARASPPVVAMSPAAGQDRQAGGAAAGRPDREARRVRGLWRGRDRRRRGVVGERRSRAAGQAGRGVGDVCLGCRGAGRPVPECVLKPWRSCLPTSLPHPLMRAALKGTSRMAAATPGWRRCGRGGSGRTRKLAGWVAPGGTDTCARMRDVRSCARRAAPSQAAQTRSASTSLASKPATHLRPFPSSPLLPRTRVRLPNDSASRTTRSLCRQTKGASRRSGPAPSARRAWRRLRPSTGCAARPSSTGGEGRGHARGSPGGCALGGGPCRRVACSFASCTPGECPSNPHLPAPSPSPLSPPQHPKV